MRSVKLCVTVMRHLKKKYNKKALQEITRAVKDWIAADAARGIQTVVVAVDDAASMGAHRLRPLTGRITAVKIKRAIDALWGRLQPEYLVLLGGADIVPMFLVANPSYDPNGDDDQLVPTDNPYASSSPYRASNRGSYLVPDRVAGRIPDMVADSSSAWLVDSLATATTWTSRPASFYGDRYAVCCAAWQGAGEDCVQHIGSPVSSLMISPPITDASATARSRLSFRLHMIKCHGAPLNPNFYGQTGNSFPVALASPTLTPRVKPATVAAAMCCYGAQIYSPNDPAAQNPGEWPIASTYLRQGALGLAASTVIAWVGVGQMMCADWIVAGYLKGILGGASQGRALLESKQDYVRWINQQGQAPDIADEKTLIEYVLLGDPSIQPVVAPALTPATGVRAATAGPAFALLAQERRQRRVVRAQLAGQLRGLLPSRTAAPGAARTGAGKVFRSAQAALGATLAKSIKEFRIRPAAVRVEKLDTPLSFPAEAAGRGRVRAMASVPRTRQSIEYYWSGRQVHDGHRRICLMKAETDRKGNLLRASLVHSS